MIFTKLFVMPFAKKKILLKKRKGWRDGARGFYTHTINIMVRVVRFLRDRVSFIASSEQKKEGFSHLYRYEFFKFPRSE